MSYMLYHLNELKKASLWPAHTMAEWGELFWKMPGSSLSFLSPLAAASNEVLERSTRVYTKPSFNLHSIKRAEREIFIKEKIIYKKPFCNLLYFKRLTHESSLEKEMSRDPTVLIIAPLSGHFSTLLRDTVRAMLPYHQVYITDWVDAKEVPLSKGNFDFEDNVEYLLDYLRLLGPLHVIAVCQASVPALVAGSLLSTHNDSCQPKTMTLMGGPIDTRINPGQVNIFTKEHSLEWMKRHIITQIPAYYPGAGREVCPGFIILSGFMSMNLDRHQEAVTKLFTHLVQGDQESAETHRKFYDEYLCVLDLSADYFLNSIKIAFQEHLLPKGALTWKGYPVRPQDIQKTAILTIEGERDDISCVGQTAAALELCTSLPSSMKQKHIQKGVGHYGIFNGHRWRERLQPKIASFIRAFN